MDNGDTKTTGDIRGGTKRLAGEAIAGGRGGLDSAEGAQSLLRALAAGTSDPLPPSRYFP